MKVVAARSRDSRCGGWPGAAAPPVFQGRAPWWRAGRCLGWPAGELQPGLSLPPYRDEAVMVEACFRPRAHRYRLNVRSTAPSLNLRTPLRGKPLVFRGAHRAPGGREPSRPPLRLPVRNDTPNSDSPMGASPGAASARRRLERSVPCPCPPPRRGWDIGTLGVLSSCLLSKELES